MRLEPGMIVAKPVTGGIGQQITIHLPAGALITASTIAQLVNKGVECVAVERAQTINGEAGARLVSQYESRLDEIFGLDPDENCRSLWEALRKDIP